MIISGSDGIDTVYSQYTKVDGANLVFIVSGSVGGSTPSGTLYYSKQPLSYDRGDFEYKGSTDIAIPEINMDLESLPIVAKTKKLKAQWTPEIAQDLNAYQSIDAEAELTTILSDQISMEIDLEILSMLLLNTDTTEY